MLEKAAEQLMSCFRVCASDKSVPLFSQWRRFVRVLTFSAMCCSRAGIDDSKKWGMMFLSNQLFKIYFKVLTPS